MKSEKKLFRPLFNHGGAQIEFLGSLDWLQVAIGLRGKDWTCKGEAPS